MRIEPKVVRYVSGIATAPLGSEEFTKEVYTAAKVDPIAQFSKPVSVLLLIWYLCETFFSSVYHSSTLFSVTPFFFVSLT